MKRQPKFVAYYRVSTKKQGESGLGLEAQKQMATDHAKRDGGVIVAEYTEVESGKLADRPELAKAIAHAKAANATLLVAKLDRLSRNVSFTSALMDNGCDFVCCDNPHATPLTIHILAAVAQDEAKRISERTKAALAAYKARGGKLGSARPEGRKLYLAAQKRGAKVSGSRGHERAVAHAKPVIPIITALRSQGKTLQAIATYLNSCGFETRRRKPYSHVQVLHLLRRAEVAAAAV